MSRGQMPQRFAKDHLKRLRRRPCWESRRQSGLLPLIKRLETPLDLGKHCRPRSNIIRLIRIYTVCQLLSRRTWVLVIF